MSNNLSESLSRIKSLMNINEVVSTGFNTRDLRMIKSFKDRLAYCSANLRRIGSGSSRVVFEIDDKTVLKLAKNKKGLAQNYTEGDGNMQSQYDHVIAKVYDQCNDDMWIVAEKARKAKNDDFYNLIGISYNIFVEYIYMREYDLHPQKYKGIPYGHGLSDEQINFCDNHEFIGEIMELMANYDLAAGDLAHITSYGVVNRGGHDTLVLIDAGASVSTIENMYEELI